MILQKIQMMPFKSMSTIKARLNFKLLQIYQLMKNQNKKKVVGEYEIFLDKKLGVGGFGQVYQGYNTKTKQIVAVKMIQRINNDHGSMKQQYLINALKRQTLILSKISSENVVAFKDILSTKRYYYIVQQKCDQDLKKLLLKQPDRRLSEEKALQVMTQILNGFYALIITNVIHRDIKPQNFLIKNGKIKIADFGLSRRVHGDEMMVSAVGTKSYSSPQILRHEKYTSKCDIWSLGCVFYEMLYGKILFKVPQEKLMTQILQIQQDGLEFPTNVIVSENSKNIIRSCIRLKEQDRADWQYLFNHPFFVNKVPLIKKMNLSLNLIISTIRREIDEKNIDLEKFFKKIGVTTNHQLNLGDYTKILIQIVSANKLTMDEIKFSFNYFDKDRSGKISFEQFAKTLQNYGVQMKGSSRQKIMSNIINHVTTNQQGKQDQSLSKEQIQLAKKTEQAYQKLLVSMVDKNIQNFEEEFKLTDLNEKGLNLIQFTHFVKEKFEKKLTQEQCKLIFNKFDDDKNEVISLEEFRKYLCQMLELPESVSYTTNA